MNNLKSIIFLSIFCLFVCPLFSLPDNLNLDHYSTQDGLPSNEINCIFQDRTGFLWFGTNAGLVRYDGYEMVVYTHDPASDHGISGNQIVTLKQDAGGYLWIGTADGGLNRFDPATKSFDRFQHRTGDVNSLSSNRIYSLFLDSRGFLWIFHQSRYLDRINTDTLTLKRFRHDPENPATLSSDRISNFKSILVRRSAVCEDSEGFIWIGTEDGGLSRYSFESGTFVRHVHAENDSGSLSHNHVTCIFEDSRKDLWISTWGGGLNRYNPETQTFRRMWPETGSRGDQDLNHGITIYEDRQNTLWFACWNALARFHPEKNIFSFFRGEPLFDDSGYDYSYIPYYEDEEGLLHFYSRMTRLMVMDPVTEQMQLIAQDPDDTDAFSPPAVLTSFCKDFSGSLWLGTHVRGLFRMNRKNRRFDVLQKEPFNSRSLRSNRITSLLKSASIEGGLWISSTVGLDYLDLNTKIVERYRDRIQTLMAGKTILCLSEDESGNLWIGTRGEGLYKYNFRNRKLKHFPLESGEGMEASVWTIFMDPSNEVWISTMTIPRGIHRLTESARLISYPHPDDPNYRAWCFSSIDENRFFVGTEKGLYVFDRHDSSFSEQYLKNRWISCIHRDRLGRIWLGTAFSGLCFFDWERGKAEFFNIGHGLVHNKVNSIAEDDQGNLWLGTEGGLSVFSYDTRTFSSFTKDDGLPSGFFQLSVPVVEAGEIFMPTVDRGIVIFDPDKINANQIPPRIVITNFKILNRKESAGSANADRIDPIFLGSIKLAHHQHDIQIEMTALHFDSPKNNQYKNRLENEKKSWSMSGENRNVTYTNLDPGDYIFFATAANSDGVWNETGVSLKFSISPPWWKTAWAYLLYALIFGIATWCVVRFYISRSLLKRQVVLEHEHAVKLQELDRMKSRFFANISHEFRTPLTLIIGPLQKILSENEGGALAKEHRLMLRNGQRLLRLISQLLDLSRLESGSMSLRVSPLNIVDVLQTTVRFFASWAESKNIQLTFSADEDDILLYIDRDKVEKIFSNLLSNAFKFTPEGGEIDVRILRLNTETVEMTVTDSGPGIGADHLERIFDRFYQLENSRTHGQEGSGIGLALTRELVELHHGSVGVQSPPSGKETGTSFSVVFRSGKDHFREDEVAEQEIPKAGQSSSFMAEPGNGTQDAEAQSGDRPDVGLPLVLIVEDNGDVRQYMQNILREDYSLLEATDGISGLKMATENVPDLIVSDVMMPRMDGFEFCRRVKTDEKTSHIPVILLTARASGESKLEGLETGADDYLTKPFESGELKVRIRNLIDGRRKLAEHFRRQNILNPQNISVSSVDDLFLRRTRESVEKHISDPEFTTERFAGEVYMSRMQLSRKLKALTGYTTHGYIRMLRLKRAAQLLQQGAGTVTEIIYDVGFNNLSHFAKVFREEFGMSPSEYTEKNYKAPSPNDSST